MKRIFTRNKKIDDDSPTTSTPLDDGSSSSNRRVSTNSNPSLDAALASTSNTEDFGAPDNISSAINTNTSTYRSNSLFSNHGTFDSNSMMSPNSTNISSNHGKLRSTRLGELQSIQETNDDGSFRGGNSDFQHGDETLQRPGGFLSQDIGKPLRVISADRYNELSHRPSTASSSSSLSIPHHSSIGSAHIYSKPRKYSDGGTGSVSGAGMSVGGDGVGSFTGSEGLGTGNHANTSRVGSIDSIPVESLFSSLEKVEKDLFELNENLLELVDQFNQSVINTSRATLSLVELIDACCINGLNPHFKLPMNDNLRNVLKIVLQFHDTYLRFEVYDNSKKFLVRSINELLIRLRHITDAEYSKFDTLPFVKNFAINLSNEDPIRTKVEQIMDKMLTFNNSSLVSDQQGAFIAPISRGITSNTSILSIMFGLPDPQPDHYDIINAMFQTFSDVHFFIVKDFIKSCASGNTKQVKFKPPFRIPNRKSPEISISISAKNGLKSSGTLGGYIKPIITPMTDRSLLKYKGSKFALTCGHVLLGEEEDYPEVSVPSDVLMNAYKSALSDERDKFSDDTVEFKSYDLELTNCDKYSTKLGQVIWGERILIRNKISDLAIVKIDDSFKKIENFIGDDDNDGSLRLPINLKFQNLYIKKTIPTSSFHKHSKIFKIGSSTNYTTGDINGIKLIYWLDGHLQTSEFVVASPNPMFANGGDSGSLLLNDLSYETGLGVVGMLHSYDGELKQLGLFTPVEDILKRLYEVTGIEWEFI